MKDWQFDSLTVWQFDNLNVWEWCSLTGSPVESKIVITVSLLVKTGREALDELTNQVQSQNCQMVWEENNPQSKAKNVHKIAQCKKTIDPKLLPQTITLYDKNTTNLKICSKKNKMFTKKQ